MPLENPEEEALARIPDLRIAQLKFLLEHPELEVSGTEIKKNLMEEIKKNKMTPFYKSCCKDLQGWKEDQQLIKVKTL